MNSVPQLLPLQVTAPIFLPDFLSCEGCVSSSFRSGGWLQQSTAGQPQVFSEGGKFLLLFCGEETAFHELTLLHGSTCDRTGLTENTFKIPTQVCET